MKVPSGATKLPDLRGWTNRIEIKSETSRRTYVVSQNATKRHWGCSCPGWRKNRHCKHLKAMGLPGNEMPYEPGEEMAKKKKGFMDGYKEYDASESPGSAEEWRSKFESHMSSEDASRILHGRDPYSALGLAPGAGWEDVEKAYRAAVQVGLKHLTDQYQAAVDAFGSADGDFAEQAEKVKVAKFKLQCYVDHLGDQKEKLELHLDRVDGILRERITSMEEVPGDDAYLTPQAALTALQAQAK